MPLPQNLKHQMPTSNRAIFFSNTLSNGGHNGLSTIGDVGMFWTNTGNSSGFILGPVSAEETGMRINNRGRFGFNTQPIYQVQYALKSNSLVGLVVSTGGTTGINYGIRALALDPTDVAFSVGSDAIPVNPDVFSVKGNGSVNIKTSPTTIDKPFTITDIPSGEDVFRVLNNGNVFATRVIPN